MYDIFLEAFHLVIINLSQDESSGNEIINLYCFLMHCNQGTFLQQVQLHPSIFDEH